MYLSGLDEQDRKILNLLTQNARYTYSEIGEKLGLSRVAIKNRIDALEQRGVIRGIHGHHQSAAAGRRNLLLL